MSEEVTGEDVCNIFNKYKAHALCDARPVCYRCYRIAHEANKETDANRGWRLMIVEQQYVRALIAYWWTQLQWISLNQTTNPPPDGTGTGN